MVRADQRSDEAKAWRKWYSLAFWRRAKAAQLQAKPLCERCQANGFIIPASVVNHRTPHKGDWSLFANPANHQSVCQPCHDQAIQSEERTGQKTNRVGFTGAVDRDGWPMDPRHPANRGG